MEPSFISSDTPADNKQTELRQLADEIASGSPCDRIDLPNGNHSHESAVENDSPLVTPEMKLLLEARAQQLMRVDQSRGARLQEDKNLTDHTNKDPQNPVLELRGEGVPSFPVFSLHATDEFKPSATTPNPIPEADDNKELPVESLKEKESKLNQQINSYCLMEDEQLKRIREAEALLSRQEDLRFRMEAKLKEQTERERAIRQSISALLKEEESQSLKIKEYEARCAALEEKNREMGRNLAAFTENEKQLLEQAEGLKQQAGANRQLRDEFKERLQLEFRQLAEAEATELRLLESLRSRVEHAKTAAVERAEEEARLLAEAEEQRNAQIEARKKIAEQQRLLAEAEAQGLAAEEEAKLAQLQTTRDAAKAEQQRRLLAEQQLKEQIQLLAMSEAEQMARIEASAAQLLVQQEKRDQAQANCRQALQIQEQLQRELDSLVEREQEERDRIAKATQQLNEATAAAEERAAEEARLLAAADAQFQAELAAQRKFTEQHRLAAEAEARTRAAEEEQFLAHLQVVRDSAAEEARQRISREQELNEEIALLAAAQVEQLAIIEAANAQLLDEKVKREETEARIRVALETHHHLQAELQSLSAREQIEQGRIAVATKRLNEATAAAQLRTQEEARLLAAAEAQSKAEMESRRKFAEQQRLAAETEARKRADDEEQLLAILQVVRDSAEEEARQRIRREQELNEAIALLAAEKAEQVSMIEAANAQLLDEQMKCEEAEERIRVALETNEQLQNELQNLLEREQFEQDRIAVVTRQLDEASAAAKMRAQEEARLRAAADVQRRAEAEARRKSAEEQLITMEQEAAERLAEQENQLAQFEAVQQRLSAELHERTLREEALKAEVEQLTLATAEQIARISADEEAIKRFSDEYQNNESRLQHLEQKKDELTSQLKRNQEKALQLAHEHEQAEQTLAANARLEREAEERYRNWNLAMTERLQEARTKAEIQRQELRQLEEQEAQLQKEADLCQQIIDEQNLAVEEKALQLTREQEVRLAHYDALKDQVRLAEEEWAAQERELTQELEALRDQQSKTQQRVEAISNAIVSKQEHCDEMALMLEQVVEQRNAVENELHLLSEQRLIESQKLERATTSLEQAKAAAVQLAHEQARVLDEAETQRRFNLESQHQFAEEQRQAAEAEAQQQAEAETALLAELEALLRTAQAEQRQRLMRREELEKQLDALEHAEQEQLTLIQALSEQIAQQLHKRDEAQGQHRQSQQTLEQMQRELQTLAHLEETTQERIAQTSNEIGSLMAAAEESAQEENYLRSEAETQRQAAYEARQRFAEEQLQAEEDEATRQADEENVLLAKLQAIREAAEAAQQQRIARQTELKEQIQLLAQAEAAQLERIEVSSTEADLQRQRRDEAQVKLHESLQTEENLRNELQRLAELETEAHDRIVAATKRIADANSAAKLRAEEEAELLAEAEQLRQAEFEARQRFAEQRKQEARAEVERKATEEQALLAELQSILDAAEAQQQERLKIESDLLESIDTCAVAEAEELVRIQVAREALQNREQEVREAQAHSESLAQEHENVLAKLETIRARNEEVVLQHAESEQLLRNGIEALGKAEELQLKRIAECEQRIQQAEERASQLEKESSLILEFEESQRREAELRTQTLEADRNRNEEAARQRKTDDERRLEQLRTARALEESEKQRQAEVRSQMESQIEALASQNSELQKRNQNLTKQLREAQEAWRLEQDENLSLEAEAVLLQEEQTAQRNAVAKQEIMRAESEAQLIAEEEQKKLAQLEAVRAQCEADVQNRASLERELTNALQLLRDSEQEQFRRIEELRESIAAAESAAQEQAQQIERLQQEQDAQLVSAHALRLGAAEERQKAEALFQRQAEEEARRGHDLRDLHERTSLEAEQYAQEEAELRARLNSLNELHEQHIQQLEELQSELRKAEASEEEFVRELSRLQAEKSARQLAETERRRQLEEEQGAALTELQELAARDGERIARLTALRSKAEHEAQARAAEERQLTVELEALRKSHSEHEQKINQLKEALAAESAKASGATEETPKVKGRRKTTKQPNWLELLKTDFEATKKRLTQKEEELIKQLALLRDDELQQLRRVEELQTELSELVSMGAQVSSPASLPTTVRTSNRAGGDACAPSTQTLSGQQSPVLAVPEVVEVLDQQEVVDVVEIDLDDFSANSSPDGQEIVLNQQSVLETSVESDHPDSNVELSDTTIFEPSMLLTSEHLTEGEISVDVRGDSLEPASVVANTTNYNEFTEQQLAVNSKAVEPVIIEKGVAPFEQNALPAELLERLKSAEPEERASALIDLSKTGEEAFDAVVEMFDDPQIQVRNAAAIALSNLSPDRVGFFTRALREAPPQRRRTIGETMATSGIASEAISRLVGEGREKTYDAFSILFLMAKTGVIRPLIDVVENYDNLEARLAVIRLLAFSSQAEIVPIFRRLVVRVTLPPEVRSALMEAIHQLGTDTKSESNPNIRVA